MISLKIEGSKENSISSQFVSYLFSSLARAAVKEGNKKPVRELSVGPPTLGAHPYDGLAPPISGDGFVCFSDCAQSQAGYKSTSEGQCSGPLGGQDRSTQLKHEGSISAFVHRLHL